LIRLASEADASKVAAIYAPYCTDSSVSFEEAAPTADVMWGRISATLERYPWLVYDDGGGEIWGYAYASRHRERAAYRWSAEVSAYVHPEKLRRGIGRALYTELFGQLVELGYYRAFAGITLPNPASVALHEKMGFVPVGIFRQIGYKRGEWHDVGWWQKELQPLSAEPADPRSLCELSVSALTRSRGMSSSAGPIGG
jgi:phosphinothricin acetyltransferase